MATSTSQDLVALQAFLRQQEAAAIASAAPAPALERKFTLKIGNSCAPAKREGYFLWTLFVHSDGSFNVGDRVKSVTVTLHPTFSNNVIVMNNAPFHLTRAGWGTFDVGVQVELYADSTKQKTVNMAFTHELSFDEGGACTDHSVTLPQADQPRPQPPVPKSSKGTLREDLMVDFGLSPSTAPSQKAEKALTRAMHGRLGDQAWDAPVKVVHCDMEARPGYATRKAHEYNDTPQVLRAKVRVLADMIRRSRAMAAYTGAGISTASGIGDYASKAKDTTCGKGKKKVRSIDAAPTLAHRVLAALHRANYLKHWVQQNHDGLPQKAGFPQPCLNEIHGAWQDPSNPVVPMDGHLRGDLIDLLQEWEDKADLCLVLGTSMCGMAADDFALSVNARAKNTGNRLGMVVVSLQQTQHDSKAALRIFAKIDVVMALVAEELAGPIDSASADNSSRGPLVVLPYTLPKPLKGPHESVFKVPYRSSGDKARSANQLMVLDLRPGAAVRVTRGVGKGFVGTVRGMTGTGDYVLNLPLQRENHPARGKKRSVYTLGRWWIQDALKGEARYLPVVNESPQFVRRQQEGGNGGESDEISGLD